MSLVSINPATGKLVRRYAGHSPAQVETALARADRAALVWRATSLSSRARHLRGLAATLRRRSDRYAALIGLEMGKPVTQARAEIEKCALCCDFYARHGAGFLEAETPTAAPQSAKVEYEALGAVLAIMPWNFPFWQAIRAAAPTLVAGNVVLLKHASNVSGCALAIESAFKESGFPRGVFQTLLLSPDAVPRLIADDRVHAVTLTGSTEAGKKVAAVAGAALKPCVFELGGSDPYLVFEDTDLDHAAEVCASARLVNSGQSCVAAKRFIVAQGVRKPFEEKLVARMLARRQGDPSDPATDLGPLAREDLRKSLHAQVQRSVKAGARLVTGGAIPSGPGYFYPATVLSDVKPGTPAYDDELFGPVASVISARDEAHAIHIANDTPFGLGAAVFTANRARARRVASALRSGMVCVNGPVRSDVALPFGGIKRSGYGRELSHWGVQAFVNAKTVRWDSLET